VVYCQLNAPSAQRVVFQTEPRAANDQCCDQEQQPRWRLLVAS